MKKIIKIIFILLVVLIIAVVLGVHFFLDGAVKKAVETIGPQITKVDVKLDSVSISILSGSGKIKGLVIGNPEGFKSPSSISLGKASLGLKTTSLLSDKIVIRSIVLEAPEITFEQSLKGNNLLTLQKNLGGDASTKEQPKEQPKEKSAAAKKLQVDDVLITGGKIHVTVSALGGKSATVPLPPIHFTNLGTGADGITPAELSKRILSEIIEGAMKEGEKTVTDLAKGAVIMSGGLATNATGKIGKTLDGVGDLFKKK